MNSPKKNFPAIKRALWSRTGFVVGMAVALIALAAMARLQPVLAQTPDAVDVPTSVASVDAAAFVQSADPEQPAFVPGELLVGVQAGGAAAFASSGTVAGFSVDSVVAADEGVLTQVVEVPVGGELAAAQTIAQQPGVLFVEPNGYVWAAQDDFVPDALDASTSEAAAYNINDAFYASEQWNMQRIGLARAWQLAFASGRFAAPSTSIIVSVIDSGIDPTHPEFAGRLLPGKNYVSLAQESLSACKEARFNVPMLDNYGHGTHVAGIIAAASNNSLGVVGIAPMIKIDPRRALGCQGGGTIANVAQAIRDAADAGADVINLSLVVANYFSTLDEAIEYAADAGVVIVAASGNAGINTVYYPAAFPEVIAVGALNYYDDATTYSNSGPEIDLAAPGGDAGGLVFSTWPSPASFPLDGLGQPKTRCANLRSSGTGNYCTNFGTSFASPAVAGVAALLLSLDPTLTPGAVRSILLGTATPLPGQLVDKVGAGKLNAYGAVRALLDPTVEISPAGIFDNALATDLPYTVTLRVENPGTASVAWQADLDVDTALATAEASPFAAGATPWIALTSGINNDQSGNATFSNPGFLTLRVVPAALEAGFNTSQLSVDATTPGGALHLHSDISVLLGELLARISLPLIMRDGPGGGTVPMFVADAPDVAPEVAAEVTPDAEELASADADGWVNYAWATPDNLATVLTLTIPAEGNVAVNMPYTASVAGSTYNSLRVHENGFVTLPNTVAPSELMGGNRCMPFVDAYGEALFGWWANLDGSAAGAKITTFTASGKRFVVQYENLPAVGVARPYKVTFQIVLDQLGNVRYNYKSVPAPDGKPALATIGAQTGNGRFYSETLCSTPTQTFGEAPASMQSLLIKRSDMY